jgi:pimeloyl-ACP methyl ester carboxylesterase
MPSFAAAGAARIHYDDEGSGPLVVLLHGGTGTGAYDWEFQRGPLSNRFRLVIPDMRGHGRSSDPEFLLGPEQIGEDLLGLIDHLGERPAAIVAFSVGATATLRLLCRRPDITDAFVTIAASLHARPDRVQGIVEGPWPSGLTALHHEHGSGPQHWRRLRERLSASFWRDFEAIDDDDLAGMTVPTLAVYGDRDPIEPVEIGLRIARAVPEGELLVLPGAGHFISRSHPEELNLHVLRFFERRLAAAGSRGA